MAMCTLKIEHAIRDFETWKGAFDRDPVGRKAAGVRRHRVFRPLEDPRFVIIDLDFDTADAARTFLAALQKVWQRPELSPGLARDQGAAAVTPRTRLVEEVESQSY
jgi:hypothetical protein